MRIPRVGHAVFAAILIALGIVGLVKGDFTPVWEPVPKDVPAREALAYLCAVVSVATGSGLLWRRTSARAALVLLGLLLLWIVLFRVRAIIAAPTTFPPWDGCAETAVITAAACALHGQVRTARVLFGLAMISFGLGHFIYPQDTANLVPGWIPGHMAVTYFTGCAFVAVGAAALTGVLARWAAALATLQMGLFTLLVWVPMIARGSANAFQWSELGISAALTAAGWVVADSYRARAISPSADAIA